MKELTLRKIAEACHGTVTPEAETVTVTGVQSDSRRVRPGDLFVAIKGEKADGHDFVAMAASLGAKAALAILSSTTPDRFALAIFSQDEKALTAAPGVGKKLAQRILPLLTEEEQAVFRRGRNANVHSIPTHASRAQYQQATALEALLGWLHLSGRHDRVEQLFAVMMEEE